MKNFRYNKNRLEKVDSVRFCYGFVIRKSKEILEIWKRPFDFSKKSTPSITYNIILSLFNRKIYRYRRNIVYKRDRNKMYKELQKFLLFCYSTKKSASDGTETDCL